MYETKIHDIDDLQKRLKQTWFDFHQDIIHATIDQWLDHPRSCVCACGRHFEYMLWNECLFIRFIKTFYETLNVIWCISWLFCS